ncbi:phosphoglycerate mutase GpmB [Paenibacillus solanacearum]|uniref:Phosphoglycerate mutase GpmB n=1 Tax=Paenibacillus solanacearum TaxID=2048548 RepID=A0A916NQ51_9BACL|nr:histidine phosphatase family protein [Paenibacillus solanacearum]CAG7629811.1 phosphoglycerate mutase GpmB [Paenibacillus solanacearum]
MNTTFYLIRHALKQKAIGDVPITPEGKIQAKRTARALANLPIAAIVTSPLRRAKQTAEVIASTVQTSVSVDHRLRERANWGDLPKQTFEEFVAMWERCTRNPDYRPPVGDSAKLAGSRLASALVELAGTHSPDSSIVIVTHGGIITDFLVQMIPEHQLQVWHPHFVAVQSDLVPECSITKLVYAEGRFQMVDFASVVHLQGDDAI